MTAATLMLSALMRSAPFQPATNVWRAVELDAVRRHGLPAGLGLDLGCGDGKLTRVLMDAMGDAARGIEWVGVDIDPAETALARAGGLYRRVHTGSAAALPEPDGSFHFVFSNSVLEHVGPIDEVLAEAARLLAPGGCFICTVPGPDFHACLRGPALPAASRADYLRDIDTRCAHLRYWAEADWQQHLGAVGLQLTHAAGYLSQRQTRRWERLSSLTGGLAWRLFGRGARPIEIQRRLRMRSDRSPTGGRLGAALAPWFSLGCPLEADDRAGGRFGCLLIEAVKR